MSSSAAAGCCPGPACGSSCTEPQAAAVAAAAAPLGQRRCCRGDCAPQPAARAGRWGSASCLAPPHPAPPRLPGCPPRCRFFGQFGFGGFGGMGQEEEQTPKGHNVLVELEVSLKDLYLGQHFKVGGVNQFYRSFRGVVSWPSAGGVAQRLRAACTWGSTGKGVLMPYAFDALCHVLSAVPSAAGLASSASLCLGRGALADTVVRNEREWKPAACLMPAAPSHALSCRPPLRRAGGARQERVEAGPRHAQVQLQAEGGDAADWAGHVPAVHHAGGRYSIAGQPALLQPLQPPALALLPPPALPPLPHLLPRFASCSFSFPFPLCFSLPVVGDMPHHLSIHVSLLLLAAPTSPCCAGLRELPQREAGARARLADGVGGAGHAGRPHHHVLRGGGAHHRRWVERRLL